MGFLFAFKRVPLLEGRQGGHRVSDPLAQDVVVMKFGGTSVEDAEAIRRVVSIVRNRARRSAVVVVSALAGVTDELVAVADHAAQRRFADAQSGVMRLRARHFRLADELLRNAAHVEFRQGMKERFAELESFLKSVVTGDLTPSAKDHILGFGEVFSSRLLAEVFNAADLRATWVDARRCIITDGHHGRARPLPESEWQVREALQPLMASGQIPVMGGFVAATGEGVPTTLGRGGSDLSASVVGSALDAREIEIWTDVNGIMTADPRLCPDANVIPTITFKLAAELAHLGAKVLHPATLLPAMRKNIPVCVRNSRRPNQPGTRVVSDGGEADSVAAITVKKGIAYLIISADGYGRPELLRHALEICEHHECGIELVLAAGTGIELLVSSFNNAQETVAELENLGTSVAWKNHKALISVLSDGDAGQEKREQLLNALGELHVRVIGRGLPGERLCVVVDESEIEISVRRLHRALFPIEACSEFNLCTAGQ